MGAVVDLHSYWNLHVGLYGNDRHVALMSDVLPGPFLMIRNALLTHIAMGIGRLLDPAEDSFSKRPNLSFERLLKTIQPHCPQKLNARLATMLGEAQTHYKPLKKWRHRHFAHADMKMKLAKGGGRLPAVERQEFQKLLDVLRALLAEIHAHFNVVGPQMPFPAREHDADRLVEYIRAGYESLQEDP